MRQFICAVIAIGLAGCCTSIPTRGPVRANLRGLRNDIFTFRASLHPLYCASGRCYAGSEVGALFRLIQARLDAFPPEAAALKGTLEAFIDVERAKLGDPQLLSPIHLVQIPPALPLMGFPAIVVDRVLVVIAVKLDRLNGYSSLELTLFVTSDPDGAEFEVRVGKTTVWVPTNGRIKAWRAVYSGSVSKLGYKDAPLKKLDLIDNSLTGISCKLYKVTESENSRCQIYEVDDGRIQARAAHPNRP